MRCSNCGKDVPFNGKVCPYCHVDKSSDQATHTAGVIGSTLSGNWLGWGFGGMVVGMVGCMVWVQSQLAKAKKVPTAPTVQRVEVVSPVATVAQTSGDDKTCPFCAETIKRAALVCRYCNRDLPAATTDGVASGS